MSDPITDQTDSTQPQALADLRLNYTRQTLTETEVDPDPIRQFQRWFDQAIAAQVPEPNAMTLATVDPDGSPSARIVLLKGISGSGLGEQGFVFYTNFNSRKGQALSAHPQAALVFLWHELERQVRIEGPVTRVADAEVEAYFHSRPESSQLGAWASPQSEAIADRRVLEQNFEAVRQRYAGQTIPRPPHWGGYQVTPTFVEFWQGRPSRLHDRLCYRRMDRSDVGRSPQGWVLQRLAP